MTNDRGQMNVGLIFIFAILIAVPVVISILVFGAQVTADIFDAYEPRDSNAFKDEIESHEEDTGGRYVMIASGLVISGLLAVTMVLYSSNRPGRGRGRRL